MTISLYNYIYPRYKNIMLKFYLISLIKTTSNIFLNPIKWISTFDSASQKTNLNLLVHSNPSTKYKINLCAKINLTGVYFDSFSPGKNN